jgi:hypothetical protein
MAMVLYEGKSIAFGSSEEIFKRVRAGVPPGAAAQAPAVAQQSAPPPNTKAVRRAAAVAGSV